MKIRLTHMLLALSAALPLIAAPASAAPLFRLKKVVTAVQPTVVTSAPGQPRLTYVAQRRGQIRIFRNDRFLPGVFLDISRRVKTTWIEQGLLGLAFPPDYAKSGRFYVHYTNRVGDILVEEFRRSTRNPRMADPRSRRILIKVKQVIEGGGHNGGAMHFIGNELYISVGDGSNPGDLAGNARNLESLRGKILRIIPRPDWVNGRTYRIPSSNPLIGKPGRDEIFAWGLRNPHSFSFHKPASGPLQMMIADVGQNRFEEINYVPFARALGGNFGWNLFEGSAPYNCGSALCPNGGPLPFPPDEPPDGPPPDRYLFPALEYSHEQGCAVIGGPVVADPGLPSLRGRIIYGDFCNSTLRSAAPADPVVDARPIGIFMPPGRGRHPALNGIGSDRFGRIYPFSHFGPIYRLLETGPGPESSRVRKSG